MFKKIFTSLVLVLSIISIHVACAAGVDDDINQPLYSLKIISNDCSLAFTTTEPWPNMLNEFSKYLREIKSSSYLLTASGNLFYLGQATSLNWIKVATGVYDIVDKLNDVYNIREMPDSGITILVSRLSLESLKTITDITRHNHFMYSVYSDDLSEWIHYELNERTSDITFLLGDFLNRSADLIVDELEEENGVIFSDCCERAGLMKYIERELLKVVPRTTMMTLATEEEVKNLKVHGGCTIKKTLKSFVLDVMLIQAQKGDVQKE